MEQILRPLERTIGCHFRSRKLLTAALTHPSYPIEKGKPRRGAENFQRLEFLGDAILNYFVATELYSRFPQADEGLLSRLRSVLVSRKLLARIAESIHLKGYLLLGEREREDPHLIREKILADAFEALIAAIYFDRGLKRAKQFLAKHFEPYFNQRKLFRFDPNPKSTLQEYTQKKFGLLPRYQSRHDKKRGLFTSWVTINGPVKAKGEGKAKQAAEAQAATALMRKLKIRKKISSPKGNAPED